MQRPSKYQIVITGGPVSGKSSVLAEIKKVFSDRIFFLGEVATRLLDVGLPSPGLGEWQRCLLQEAIYEVQVQLEARVQKHVPQAVLVLDRGTLDGAAYWTQGPDAFLRHFGTTWEKELARYAAILHLETAGEADYEAHRFSNEQRFENWELAREFDLRLGKIWGRHPGYHFIPAAASFEQKTQTVIEIVKSLPGLKA